MSQLVKDFSFEKVAFVISDKYKNSAYQKKQQPHFMYYIQWNVNTGKLLVTTGGQNWGIPHSYLSKYDVGK